MIDMFRKEKEIKPVLKVGDRFAMQYLQLTTPLTEKVYPGTSIKTEKDVHKLKKSRQSYLWTVVEYLGNGLFLDLITNEVFTTQISSDEVQDTVTQSYYNSALSKQDELFSIPLAISGVSSEESFKLKKLTPELMDYILRYSIHMKDELTSFLEDLKQNARLLIMKFYDEKDLKVFLTHRIEAYKEDTERVKAKNIQIEEEKARREEMLTMIDEELSTNGPEATFAKVFTKKRLQ